MKIRNKLGMLFGAVALAYAAYLLMGINNAVVTDSGAVIRTEVENVQSYGQIYLSLDGANENNAPKILINGASIGNITENKKTLDVFNQCVVELDTRGLEEPVMLCVEGKGTNVVTNCVGRVITGSGGIDNIGTFVIENAKER